MTAATRPDSTTILVAVDLDTTSRAALKLARKQAADEDVALIVLHVVTAGDAGPASSLALRALSLGVDPDELALSEARMRLERFLSATGPVIERETFRLGVGSPAEVILKVATDVDASSIVIGTHGRGRLGHAILGSVASAVMRHAQCRVIAVHDPAEDAAEGADAEAGANAGP